MGLLKLNKLTEKLIQLQKEGKRIELRNAQGDQYRYSKLFGKILLPKKANHSGDSIGTVVTKYLWQDKKFFGYYTKGLLFSFLVTLLGIIFGIYADILPSDVEVWQSTRIYYYVLFTTYVAVYIVMYPAYQYLRSNHAPRFTYIAIFGLIYMYYYMVQIYFLYYSIQVYKGRG